MTNLYGSNDQDEAALRAVGDDLEDLAQDVKVSAKRTSRRARETAAAASGALAEAATTLARDTRTLVEEKVGKAKATAEEQYGRLKEQARVRAGEADVFVHERPYAALAVAAFAGFLIGHIISSSKASVVYLRDDR